MTSGTHLAVFIWKDFISGIFGQCGGPEVCCLLQCIRLAICSSYRPTYRGESESVEQNRWVFILWFFTGISLSAAVIANPSKESKTFQLSFGCWGVCFISTWDFLIILGLLYNDAVSCWDYITLVIGDWMNAWVWSIGGMVLTEVNWSTRR